LRNILINTKNPADAPVQAPYTIPDKATARFIHCSLHNHVGIKNGFWAKSLLPPIKKVFIKKKCVLTK